MIQTSSDDPALSQTPPPVRPPVNVMEYVSALEPVEDAQLTVTDADLKFVQIDRAGIWFFHEKVKGPGQPLNGSFVAWHIRLGTEGFEAKQTDVNLSALEGASCATIEPKDQEDHY